MNFAFNNNFFLKPLLIFFACCSFFLTNYVYGNEIIKDDILTALEQKYSGKSFQADFTQISKLAALDITEKASGRAFFSHPGKMKWQYLTPKRHEIITNGILLWIYRPEENQVMQGNASQFFQSGAGGAFLSDISLIRKNFIVTLKEVNLKEVNLKEVNLKDVALKEVAADYVEINLTAKNKTKDIFSIVIRISKETSEIVRVVTYNSYDDTTEFELSNIQFKTVDPEVFNFKTPDNVDIIDMD